MSDVLARIRVRETHGIRRFLYPLTFSDHHLSPEVHSLYRENREFVGICKADGDPVPSDIIKNAMRFAVSLAPYEEINLLLVKKGARLMVEDALNVVVEDEMVKSRQRQFTVDFTTEGSINKVVYGGVSHLRDRGIITRNGESASGFENTRINSKPLSLFVRAEANYGHFSDNCDAFITTELTACKSWLKIMGGFDGTNPGDQVTFSLPLAITAPTLTCDFGVGGYVFGKLDEKAPEIVWRTRFGDAPHARWSVATVGRTDYVGEVATAEEFLPQRWFHLIDSDKALAVAITHVPSDCREMTVRLAHEGDVSVAFTLGDTITGPAEFGLCYHFLNDVPAIAAATNPQSILLPPVVEVLPV